MDVGRTFFVCGLHGFCVRVPREEELQSEGERLLAPAAGHPDPALRGLTPVAGQPGISLGLRLPSAGDPDILFARPSPVSAYPDGVGMGSGRHVFVSGWRWRRLDADGWCTAIEDDQGHGKGKCDEDEHNDSRPRNCGKHLVCSFPGPPVGGLFTRASAARGPTLSLVPRFDWERSGW
jgi:hypothetical protein